MRLTFLFALLPLACAPNYGASRDSAIQLNANQHYAHASNGDIINGPSIIDQKVLGQADVGGNVHVVTDRWFLSRADQLATAQLELANLARDHACSPDVKALADRYAAEHQRVDEQLQSMADTHRVPLEGRPAPEQAATYQQLSQLSCENFDHAYVAAALQLDREQLDLWNQELHSTNDREMAKLTYDTLPRLENTHEMAAATSVRM